MNAKHLTLLFSALTVFSVKFLILPGLAEQKSLAATSRNAVEQVAMNQAVMNELSKLKDKPIHLQSQEMALTFAVNSWLTGQKDHGVTIAQIQAIGIATGQSKLNIDQITSTDGLTKLPIQKLTLKGQYASLRMFKSFLASQFSPEQGILIDRLGLERDGFELDVSVFSKGS